MYPLCTCTVQSAQSDGRVGKQILYIALSMIRDFIYCNESVATRKFLYVCCSYLWKRMEIDWADGIAANDRILDRVHTKTVRLFRSAIHPVALKALVEPWPPIISYSKTVSFCLVSFQLQYWRRLVAASCFTTSSHSNLCLHTGRLPVNPPIRAFWLSLNVHVQPFVICCI